MRRFLAISVALHLCALGAWWASTRHPAMAEPAGDTPITVQLVALAAPPAPAPPVAPPVPPRATPKPGAADASPPASPPIPPKPKVRLASAPTPVAPTPHLAPTPPGGMGESPSASSLPPPPPKGRLPSSPTLASENPGPNLAELAQVRSLIEQALRYPRMARRRGWQGTAMVRFQVSDGLATQVELLTPTGRAPLDEEAVAVLHRAGPYPPVPGTLEVPVHFQLR